MVVMSKDFGVSFTVGKFQAGIFSPEIPSPTAIGRGVYQVLLEIQERISKDMDEENQRTLQTQTLSMTQAAKILNTSISSLRRLIDSGKIECEKTEGKHRKPKMESVYSYQKLQSI